jgi:hypothetical protein
LKGEDHEYRNLPDFPRARIFFPGVRPHGYCCPEIAANLLGSSIFGFRYGAGRLIELAGASLTLVIVILLRQIRDGRKI